MDLPAWGSGLLLLPFSAERASDTAATSRWKQSSKPDVNIAEETGREKHGLPPGDKWISLQMD